MRDLNKVMLIGNLTRDPELRTIPSGQSVASFAIATNRAWNDASGELQKAVEFTDVVAWGKLAEIAGQILKKGRRTYIEGRLQTRNWEGQDGIKRYKTEIIASDIIVLDRPPGIGINQENQTFSSSEATAQPTKMQQPESVSSSENSEIQKEKVATVDTTTSDKTIEVDKEIDIEDIPF